VVVASEGGEIAGFGALRPLAAKAGYRYSAEDSVYVQPERQGDGIGRLILKRLIDEARQAGLHANLARITGDNPVSVRLHEAEGFQRVGVEREVGYKFGRWLDVVIMQLII
jgi:phosphinothricin acetyltransferase